MLLEFSPPSDGWMNIQINEFHLDVSDVPCDSLSHLVTILHRLHDGSPCESVEWSLEPEYASWLFERVRDELSFHLKTTELSEKILIETGPADNIVRQIATALRHLSDSDRRNDNSRESLDWSWDFPAEELDRLEALLK